MDTLKTICTNALAKLSQSSHSLVNNILTFKWTFWRGVSALSLLYIFKQMGAACLRNRGWTFNKLKLKGKHVLITGAAGGFGSQFALTLMRKGCKLTLWDINEQTLHKLKNQLIQQRRNTDLPVLDQNEWLCLAVVDVSSQSAIKQYLPKSSQQLGPIQILINNAGIISNQPCWQLKACTLQHIFQTNFMSHYYMTKSVLPSMIELNQGHILNVCSISGLFGMFGLSAYTASKHAILGLAQSLRHELKHARSGIKVSVVCPYYVRTGMLPYKEMQIGWWVPVLEADWACHRMILALEQEEEFVVLPWKLNLILPLRWVLPTKVFDAITRALSLDARFHF